MHTNQNLNDITAKIIENIHKIYKTINPDLVLVHGDTNTSFAAALAAFYNKIPVAHIEAGMRTGNINLPFPEEANRVLTSRISALHFAPTAGNVQNLLLEGIKKQRIIKTGNTVIDSLLFTSKKVKTFSSLVTDNKLKEILSQKKKIILVTGHRRENFGKGFENICKALKKIALLNKEIFIIYPVHLNPNVLHPVSKLLTGIPNILLTNPLSYPDFIFLMKNSSIILTDSGGIQEEGPSLGKPVLVMRQITERPEAVDAGTVKLVGTEPNTIVNTINKLLHNKTMYKKMAKISNPYGNGTASKKIVDWIVKNKLLIKKLKSE